MVGLTHLRRSGAMAGMIRDSHVQGGAEPLKGTRIQVAPAAEWVVRSKVRGAARRDAAPVTCLLADRQVHVPGKASYSRHVSRLETPQAVQQLSRVEIPFDPEVQVLVIHAISIFREGKLTNHARLEDIELIRREQRLDAGILNGELSALMLLKDVRTGDILDVEFTVTDEGGLFGDDMSSLQAAEQSYPVGDWRFTWMDHPDHACRVSPKPDHLSYAESEADGLLVRTWTASSIPAREPEEQLPPDVFPISILQITTHESWGGMVERLLTRWNAAPSDRSSLEVELSSIREISGDDPEKLVDAAVAAARDAVRYQNYSPGLLAMVPEDLSVIWERRFGDCKEKSLLLSWLLKECGIEACPVLVNSTIGMALPKLLPSPALFDHVVTRAEVAGRVLWIDPTDIHRGGRPSGWTHLPFAWGLPLRTGADDLLEIPDAPAGETFLKVKERVKPDSRSRAVTFDIEITTGGRRADWLRGLAGSQGMPGIQKFVKGFMETTRRGIELEEDPEYHDDRVANTGRIEVRARIPQGVQQDREYARDFVALAPFSFVGVLSGVDNPKRRTPLALGAKDRIEHEIEVEHPLITKADFPRKTVKNAAFQMDAGSRMEGSRPVYWFTCSTLEDRVPPADLSLYKTAVERAFGILDISLTLPASGKRVNQSSHDPENRWGGGIPSPRAARAGESAEAAKIAKVVAIVVVVILILIKLVWRNLV
jgi:hypothetical protein